MNQDILSEAESVKGFLKSLGLVSDPEVKSSKLEKKALEIIETILRQLKLKYHFQKNKGKDGVVFRHQITFEKEKYVLKSYLVLETEHLGIVLWSEDESDYMQVVAVGYLRDFHAMQAVGRQRLKAWMENTKKYG